MQDACESLPEIYINDYIKKYRSGIYELLEYVCKVFLYQKTGMNEGDLNALITASFRMVKIVHVFIQTYINKSSKLLRNRRRSVPSR